MANEHDLERKEGAKRYFPPCQPLLTAACSVAACPKRKSSIKRKKSLAPGPPVALPVGDSLERFVRFEVESRVDQCTELRLERDDILRENARLRNLHDERKAKLAEVVRRFSDKFTASQSRVQAHSVSLAASFDRARGDMQIALEGLQREVSTLQRELDEINLDIFNTRRLVEACERDRDAMIANQGEPGRLRDLIDAKEERFADEEADQQAMVKRAQAKFSSALGLREEETRTKASTFALDRISSQGKQLYSDNVWLQNELSTHAAENERLTRVCAELEEASIELNSRVSDQEFPPYAFTSPNPPQSRPRTAAVTSPRRYSQTTTYRIDGNKLRPQTAAPAVRERPPSKEVDLDQSEDLTDDNADGLEGLKARLSRMTIFPGMVRHLLSGRASSLVLPPPEEQPQSGTPKQPPRQAWMSSPFMTPTPPPSPRKAPSSASPRRILRSATGAASSVR